MAYAEYTLKKFNVVLVLLYMIKYLGVEIGSVLVKNLLTINEQFMYTSRKRLMGSFYLDLIEQCPVYRIVSHIWDEYMITLYRFSASSKVALLSYVNQDQLATIYHVVYCCEWALTMVKKQTQKEMQRMPQKHSKQQQ